jgi:hypothetical protein
MGLYSFSDMYKCGAQCTVHVNGYPILETVGISYQLQESKLPIYGYSSTHFDAVGRGQVLVQGSLVCNWVHQDYLYRATEMVNRELGSVQTNTVSVEKLTPENGYAAIEQAVFSYNQDGNSSSIAETLKALKQSYWSSTTLGDNSGLAFTANPSDIGGVTITIKAGQPTAKLPNGDWGVMLTSVHFLGRGKQIQVSEDVILESYPFIARNELTLASRKQEPVVVEPEPKESDYNELDPPEGSLWDTISIENHNEGSYSSGQGTYSSGPVTQ